MTTDQWAWIDFTAICLTAAVIIWWTRRPTKTRQMCTWCGHLGKEHSNGGCWHPGGLHNDRYLCPCTGLRPEMVRTHTLEGPPP